MGGSAGSRAEEEGAILETLSEGAAILSRTHLPRLAEQLQVLVKVVFDGAPGEAASNSRRQLLLRVRSDRPVSFFLSVSLCFSLLSLSLYVSISVYLSIYLCLSFYLNDAALLVLFGNHCRRPWTFAGTRRRL